MNDYNGFKWLLGNWTTNGVDFRIYAVYAKHYHGGLPKPLVVIEPNEPVIDPNDNADPNEIPANLIGYSLPNSAVVHLHLDCRYIKDKEFETLNLITELIAGKRLCSVCEKREE